MVFQVNPQINWLSISQVRRVYMQRIKEAMEKSFDLFKCSVIRRRFPYNLHARH